MVDNKDMTTKKAKEKGVLSLDEKYMRMRKDHLNFLLVTLITVIAIIFVISVLVLIGLLIATRSWLVAYITTGMVTFIYALLGILLSILLLHNLKKNNGSVTNKHKSNKLLERGFRGISQKCCNNLSDMRLMGIFIGALVTSVLSLCIHFIIVLFSGYPIIGYLFCIVVIITPLLWMGVFLIVISRIENRSDVSLKDRCRVISCWISFFS